jgi:hypothetical protein
MGRKASRNHRSGMEKPIQGRWQDAALMQLAFTTLPNKGSFLFPSTEVLRLGHTKPAAGKKSSREKWVTCEI